MAGSVLVAQVYRRCPPLSRPARHTDRMDAASLPVPVDPASAPAATAPDGSAVRVLARVPEVSAAQFILTADAVTIAHQHRTVSEVWFVQAGSGRLWRSVDGHSDVVALVPGVSVAIPVGTAFQFASDGDGLVILGATAPAWPGDDEAVRVAGPWEPTLG